MGYHCIIKNYKSLRVFFGLENFTHSLKHFFLKIPEEVKLPKYKTIKKQDGLIKGQNQ